MSNEDIIKEAVEEAKAKAAAEAGEETIQDQTAEETTDQPEVPVENTSEGPVDPEKEADSGENAEEQQESKDEKEQSVKKKFGRKPKKDEKDEKIEELTDRLTRQIAEFDNFRKRTDKEKSQMYEIGARDIIEKILPVVDNFERGLDAVPEGEESNPFAEGMEKIYKQLMAAFEEIGVKPIEAVGAEFNPDLHNAVMHVEDEELGENIVAEEFQKGYTYRDGVVRHSMVKVAN
ncbi:nucleotide exchange factor GrpE [Muricomes intestini]|uniref:nucleotide exchange factor GrpE n=1 Tax=Muricomes intestini TaxID=1796634 RepID=UPI000E9A77FE|nr:nucleotide exchange factor GrpE [Lachnospiraceae bacterium]HCR81912.1 nucleotide exchange factor GrpE [Lachnospiraceae bacterium]